MGRGKRDAGWAIAKGALEDAFARARGVEVGRVRQIGEGLSNEAFAAHVELSPDPDEVSGGYVVLLRARSAHAEGARRPAVEKTLLARVAAEKDNLRVPEIRAIVPTSRGPAIVQTFLEGIPLELRAGRQGAVRPWEVVAQVAAAIHAVKVDDLHDLPGHRTRRDHALAELAVLEGVPELAEARSWGHAHLPPDEPSCLVHGDLLGQNILIWPDEPPAVIDWEHAKRGDPAYDLAIVARGARQPFQVGGGLSLLLTEYAAQGGRAVTAAQVGLYEICLTARWYRDALAEFGDSEHAEHKLRQVENLLGRVRART